MAKERNFVMEGLRGVLALLVMLIHVVKMAAKVGLIAPLPNRVLEFLGPYRACVFFSLSGYLAFQTLHRNPSARRFAWRRAARIYPLFLILQTILFVLGPLEGYEWMQTLRHNPIGWIGHFASNGLFLPGILDLPIAQKNAWTLGYEAVFYILVVTGISSLGKAHLRNRLALGASIAASLVLLVVRPLFWFFAAGMVSFWWFELQNRRYPRVLSGGTGLVAVCIGCLVFPFSILVSSLFTLVFFSSVVQKSGWHSPFLQRPAVTWLGRISYSLYLIHPFVLDIVRGAALRAMPHIGRLPAMAFFSTIGVVFSICVARLSYSVIETRLTDYLTRSSKARPTERHSVVTLPMAESAA